MNITFLPSGKTEQAFQDETLLDVIRRANIQIPSDCGGRSVCGKCKVNVITQEGKHEVLSCQWTIKENMTISIPATQNDLLRKKMYIPKTLDLNCGVKKHVLKAGSLENTSMAERILEMTGASGIEPSVIGKLPVLWQNNTATAVVERDAIIGMEEGDTSQKLYGVSYDIGTTTVAGMLWNLLTGELLDANAISNPQSIYGADVISRITYCETQKEVNILQDKIHACMRDIAVPMLAGQGIHFQEIYKVVVVGNTTMSHLFLGISPHLLALAPFTLVYRQGIAIKAKDIGLPMNPNGTVHVLPNIGGHVGSDLIGVMVAVGVKKLKGIHIIIDIGTNGEIVLVKDGAYRACSTAAGPAFEGASIHHGMRAVAGAIEKVSVRNGDIEVKVIGNGKAAGICGSGLINAIAQLLSYHIMDKDGRLRSREEAATFGVSKNMANRLRESVSGIEFVLDWEGGIVITQKDIREVQLAKGAILAGILTLMKHVHTGVQQIESIMLAGAFGNYIDPQSALKIGIFPAIPPDKIRLIGNAAGTGAAMALLSIDCEKEAEYYAKTTRHVELACDMDFQTQFINALDFPEG